MSELFYLEVFHPGRQYPVRIKENASMQGGKMMSNGFLVYRPRGTHIAEYFRQTLVEAYALAKRPLERRQREVEATK